MCMSVVGAYVLLNLCDEFFDTLECPTADGLLGDDVEPDLDLIEP